MSRPSALDAALDYLERGWRPVPLCPPDHADCPPQHVAACHQPGAVPLVRWQEYVRRRPRASELQLFWTRYPRASVGVLLGRPSRLIAIDLEGPRGEELLHRALPPTLGLRLPTGGRRLLFAIPRDLIVLRRRVARGESHALVLGEGTPLPLPSTVHPDGAGYSWADGPSTPAPAPEWLVPWVGSLNPIAHFVAPQPPVGCRGGRAKEARPAAVSSIRLSSVRSRSLDWLWPGWLPLGKLCDLAGDPGLAKSTLLLDLAARVSTGGLMPDGSRGLGGGVCLLSAEDDLEDTILPRLRAAGADLSKIGFLDAYQGTPLVVPDHLDTIEMRLRDYDARLLLIDPLPAFLAHARTDQDVRRGLLPLARLAARQRCTVLWVRHLTKAGGAKALYRGSGLIAIGAAARSGLLVGEHPDDARTLVLAHAKSNLALRQTSLRYGVELSAERGATRITWQGRCDLTADDLVRRPATREEQERREEVRSKLQQACRFLAAILKGADALPIEEVKRAAMDACIAERTLERAAASLQLIVVPDKGSNLKGGKQRTRWHWPADAA